LSEELSLELPQKLLPLLLNRAAIGKGKASGLRCFCRHLCCHG
jgi:hypothetical protein